MKMILKMYYSPRKIPAFVIFLGFFLISEIEIEGEMGGGGERFSPLTLIYL